MRSFHVRLDAPGLDTAMNLIVIRIMMFQYSCLDAYMEGWGWDDGYTFWTSPRSRQQGHQSSRQCGRCLPSMRAHVYTAVAACLRSFPMTHTYPLPTTRLMVKIDPWLGWMIIMIISWMIGWSESRYRNYHTHDQLSCYDLIAAATVYDAHQKTSATPCLPVLRSIEMDSIS
jgi:hypothetical protein